ncbi:vesicle protein sorting-associated [Holotrichia oblita]|uniref:Vesicle protein sorting-associated n=1 Tax=Holotrichia oblita TaxID=644536 RepID=A0ACB9SVF1_HOLOL|nr:vesicle protein sorting-associated [Holotrichia oblita]
MDDDTFYKKISSLSEISKTQLSKVLNNLPGAKDIIIEPDVIRPLERLCGVSWLKNNGIEKIFKLEGTIPKRDNPQFYMIYSSTETFKHVINLIQSQLELDQQPKNKFHIICIPKILYLYEQLLEENGLHTDIVKLYSLQWQPIHIDRGILTLEIPYMFRNLFVHQDLSLLPAYAKSLWHLYFITGKPKFTIALGQHANNILKHLDMLNEDKESDKIDSDFSCLVLIDRTTDYVSTLLTPRTYTALLKDIYNVKCGVCDEKHVETEMYDEKFNLNLKKNPVQLNFDSRQDRIYNNIKNRYFTEVTSILSSLTKQLRSEKDSSKDMALDDLRRYVKTQLKEVTSKKALIANHLSAAETIINVMGHRFEKQQEIEEYIMQNKNKGSNYSYLEETLYENNKLLTLRLLCLLCITQKVSESDIKSFITKFCQEFGYNYGFLHNNLLKMDFFTQESTLQGKLIKLPNIFLNNFYINANKLKQIPAQPENVDVKSPTCMSYVFGGCYIPLIGQILSSILSSSPLKELETKLEAFGPLTIQNNGGYPLTSRVILVCIVGGITYAEVAACNLLESLTGSKIIVMSDQVVSGNDIVNSLIHSPIP